MNKTSKHVVPNASGRWAVRNSGAARVTRIFDTQAEAVRFGRTMAEKSHSDLYVHGRDGMIQRKDSYMDAGQARLEKIVGLFGRGRQKDKRSLVLEAEPHRYKAALSDLSGSDIQSHGNAPFRVIWIVRNWLKNVSPMKAPGPAMIEGAFSDFVK